MISYVDRSLIMLPCFCSFFSESKKKRKKKRSRASLWRIRQNDDHSRKRGYRKLTTHIKETKITKSINAPLHTELWFRRLIIHVPRYIYLKYDHIICDIEILWKYHSSWRGSKLMECVGYPYKQFVVTTNALQTVLKRLPLQLNNQLLTNIPSTNQQNFDDLRTMASRILFFHITSPFCRISFFV